MFRSDAYQENLVCLAIDEAHCVESGEPGVCVCTCLLDEKLTPTMLYYVTY